MSLLQTLSEPYLKRIPDLKPGYTVRVHEKIKEGDKVRTQVFEGLVIAIHRGHVPTDAMITVRRVVSGVGVEKLFPLHSPSVEKIEVKKVAMVRRAKLFFLRTRRGKAARLSERFTTSDEFSIATAAEAPSAEGAQPEESAEAEKEKE